MTGQFEREPEGKLPPYSPVCALCKHFPPVMERKCPAFPDGIPDVIWIGDDDHTTPHPGDGGILFEPRKRPQT
jgi:hypothetical protein